MMRGKRISIVMVSAIALVFLGVSVSFWAAKKAEGATANVNLNVVIGMSLTFKALPEKISPMSNDYSSHVIIEIQPAGGGSVLYSEILDTDLTGMHSTPVLLEGISLGNYDIYVKGYSHLTKKKENVALSAGNNFIDFSEGDTVYLMAGDVNVLNPLDPKQRGDDIVNSIDLAIEIEKLDQSSSIEKEDVNKDGAVNSVDLGIAIENLDKVGDN